MDRGTGERRTPRRGLWILTAFGMVATLELATTAAYAGTTEVVLNDPAVYEASGSAADGYLVWSDDSEGADEVHSYMMADGGSRVRIDPAGARSAGVSIDGTTIVYFGSTGEDDDLWFFDALTETRTPPPDGVNTRHDEYQPTLSGDWLLFTRESKLWHKVMLFNIATDERIVLRKLPYRSSYLLSDQVNGDWATFESCRQRRDQFFNCQVFRYQISTDELVKIPNPGVQQYAAAVSGDGTIYFVRTRNRVHWKCGSHVRLVRYPVGGPKVVIAELPDARDAFDTFALDETDGSTTMYFDRASCRRYASGIYRIPDADTAV